MSEQNPSYVRSGFVSEFEHAIVVGEAGRECTIFPRACDDEELVTKWVTARENGFVPLDSMV